MESNDSFSYGAYKKRASKKKREMKLALFKARAQGRNEEWAECYRKERLYSNKVVRRNIIQIIIIAGLVIVCGIQMSKPKCQCQKL